MNLRPRESFGPLLPRPSLLASLMSPLEIISYNTGVI